MEVCSSEMDDESKTRKARLDAPQPSVVVHEEYQVVDSKRQMGRAAMDEEDSGSSVVDWKPLAALVAACSCPEIAGGAGLDSEGVLLEAREVRGLGGHASMTVEVPLHTGKALVEVLGRVHEEVAGGRLACSGESIPGDTPNVHALVLHQHVQVVADSGDKDGHRVEDTDLFSLEDMVPQMEGSLYERKLKSREDSLLSFLRFVSQYEEAS